MRFVTSSLEYYVSKNICYICGGVLSIFVNSAICQTFCESPARNTPPPRRGGGPQDRRGFPPTYSICKSDISVITPRGCESPALRCAARSPARRDGFVTRTCMFSFDVSAFLLALFASFSPYLRFYRILANFRFDVFLVLRHFASLFVRLRHL